MYDILERTTPGGKMTIEKALILAIGAIVTIAFIVIAIIKTDMVPATPDDYSELNERLVNVQDGPDSFFNDKGTIKIFDDRIEYTVENDECKMTGIYNKDYQLISTSKEDKYQSPIATILMLLLCGMGIFFMSVIAVGLVYIVVGALVMGIIYMVKYLITKTKKKLSLNRF